MVIRNKAGKKKKFIRRDTHKKPRLKNRLKWRRARGRHNKMRLKRRDYPKTPGGGYKKTKKERGKIQGKNLIVIYNKQELNLLKDVLIRIGKVGLKNKLEILEKIKEKGLNFEKDLEKEIEKTKNKIKKLRETKREKRMKKKEKKKKKKDKKKDKKKQEKKESKGTKEKVKEKAK